MFSVNSRDCHDTGARSPLSHLQSKIECQSSTCSSQSDTGTSSNVQERSLLCEPCRKGCSTEARKNISNGAPQHGPNAVNPPESNSECGGQHDWHLQSVAIDTTLAVSHQ